MSKKIIGVTVGTPLSPSKIEEKLKPVKTVNGVTPDENGNVNVEAGASISLDTSLSKAGQAADAGAVGAVVQQVSQALDQLAGAIPTETTVYAWIDDYLSDALGGDY